MRRVKKWRYYCDHCKKSGASGGHMKAHEQSCCRNPQRVCRMCAHAHIDQQPLADLVAALGGGDGAGVDSLRKAASGCPACMLAAILEADLDEPYEPDTGAGFSVEFDFKAERERFGRPAPSAARLDGRSAPRPPRLDRAAAPRLPALGEPALPLDAVC